MRTAPGPAVVVMVVVVGSLVLWTAGGGGGRGSRVLAPENLGVRLLGVGVL